MEATIPPTAQYQPHTSSKQYWEVAPDSLVLSSRGLIRPKTIEDCWLQSSSPASPPTSPVDMIAVETARGYQLRGSADLALTIVEETGQWLQKPLHQVRSGARIPLRLGGLHGEPRPVPLPPLPEAYWTSDFATRVPRRMTADLAEFVGYFMGDGSLHARGIRLCVTQEDRDVVERLQWLSRSLFNIEPTLEQKQGYIEVLVTSIRLVLWWEACDFCKRPPQPGHLGKGYAPHIPDAILCSNDREIYQAFVRGLFEADGTMGQEYVSWTTSTLAFSREVQTLLLALGFVTTRKIEKPTASSWGINNRYALRLLNVVSVPHFLNEIGFISQRKKTPPPLQEHAQAARYDHIPVTRAMIDRLAPVNDNLRKTLLLSLSRMGMISRRSGDALLEKTSDAQLAYLLSYYYDTVATVDINYVDAALMSPSATDSLNADSPKTVNGFGCTVSQMLS